MKVYTKTGDKGQTSLCGNIRVDKDNIRVESYGNIDELNSYIGLCRHYIKEEDRDVLLKIQKKLFDISGELVSIDYTRFKNTTKEEDVLGLEKLIDKYREKTDNINAFIIPGTSKASANLHIARTICRRSERRIISLAKEENINEVLIKYINRLSDLLYSMGRYYEQELILIEF